MSNDWFQIFWSAPLDHLKNTSDLKVLDTWITLSGDLVTSRYEAEFEHGEFCVDVDKENTGVVGVMCDACKKGVSFILIFESFVIYFCLDTLYKYVLSAWSGI